MDDGQARAAKAAEAAKQLLEKANATLESINAKTGSGRWTDQS